MHQNHCFQDKSKTSGRKKKSTEWSQRDEERSSACTTHSEPSLDNPLQIKKNKRKNTGWQIVFLFLKELNRLVLGVFHRHISVFHNSHNASELVLCSILLCTYRIQVVIHILISILQECDWFTERIIYSIKHHRESIQR